MDLWVVGKARAVISVATVAVVALGDLGVLAVELSWYLGGS
jgi:hypothetical protein